MVSSESKAAFGIYKTRADADIAVSALVSVGFNADDISTLVPKRTGLRDFQRRQRTQIQNGAIVGAMIGSVVFVIVSVLIGLGIVPLPSGLPPNGAEQLALILGGIFGGLIFGAAIGALVGIGTPQPASHRYTDYVESGGILLSVHLDKPELSEKARTVLYETGAQDINLLKEEEGWNSVYAGFGFKKSG